MRFNGSRGFLSINRAWIELGWAEEFNTDVVCIHRREEKPSKAIQVVTGDVESYRDEDEIINVIADNT